MLAWQHTMLLQWQKDCITTVECASLVQTGRYSGLKPEQQVMTRRINWLNSIRDWQCDLVYSLSS